MNPVFKNSRTILAIVVFGVALTACNREADTSTTSPDTSSSTMAPATPDAPANTAPTPAPDATTPPSSSSTTGDMSSAAAGAVSEAGTAVEDTVITGKVKAAFLADSNVKGLEIKVDTKDGNVTLMGAVDNQAQIDNAVKIAHGIDGVKNVDNQLTVKAS